MPSDAVKERPIIFSGWEVRAILAGTKTQTRRIVKWPKWADPERDIVPLRRHLGIADYDDGHPRRIYRCPFGAPGQRLWGKETFCEPVPGEIAYRADDEREPMRRTRAERLLAKDFPSSRWRSAIHMPRWASRITLEVTEVRVQRVQDISEEDAMAEGCAGDESGLTDHGVKNEFAVLWNNIHGPGAWERNDWVFAVTFRRVQP